MRSRVPGLLCALAVVATVAAVVRVGVGHPHRTPEEMLGRIQEIDAMLPVVLHSATELRLERAELASRLQFLTEALIECRALSLADPNDPRPYALIGQFCAERNAFAEAVPPLAEAARLGNTRQITLVLDRLAQCYLQLEQPAKAQAVYRRIATASDDDIRQATWLARVCAAAEAAGDGPAAIEAITRACALADDWPSYRQQRADLLLALGRNEEAAADYAIAARLSNGPDAAYPYLVQHGLALAKAGRDEKAKEALGRAVTTIDKLLAEEPPFAEDMYRWRGEARLALGDHAGARRDAREALAGLPDADAYLRLMIAVGDAVGHDDETRQAKAVLADGVAREAKAKARFAATRDRVASEVRASMAYAVEHVVVAALCRRAIADTSGGARDAARAKAAITALRPKAATFGDAKRCALLLDVLDAHLALVFDHESAAAMIKALATAYPDDPRVRRLRLAFAQRTGDEKTAALDRKFLADVIKRADEPDLFEPQETPPPTPKKNGGDR